jgi:hypothetical protein
MTMVNGVVVVRDKELVRADAGAIAAGANTAAAALLKTI